MPIVEQDIFVYGAINMQESDSGTQGGATSRADAGGSTKVVFEDLTASGTLNIVSDAAGDTTQSITVTGRNTAGEIISDSKTLNGTTLVAVTGTFERLMKAIKSATCAGNVAVLSPELQTGNPTDGVFQAGGAADKLKLASGELQAVRGRIIRILTGTYANKIVEITSVSGVDAKIRPSLAGAPGAGDTYTIHEGMFFNKSVNGDEVDEVRRPFYDVAAEAEGGSSKVFYEKVFFYNAHASLTLTNATIKEVAGGVAAKIAFALEQDGNGTNSSTNRLTAPSGVTAFNSSDKLVYDTGATQNGNHAAGVGQGVWLELTLGAGDAPQKSTYTMEETGQSV